VDEPVAALQFNKESNRGLSAAKSVLNIRANRNENDFADCAEPGIGIDDGKRYAASDEETES
jgi:hypothetical protein